MSSFKLSSFQLPRVTGRAECLDGDHAELTWGDYYFDFQPIDFFAHMLEDLKLDILGLEGPLGRS